MTPPLILRKTKSTRGALRKNFLWHKILPPPKKKLRLEQKGFTFKLYQLIFKPLIKLKHYRLKVGRIALERLVCELNQLQPASVGEGGGM